MYVSTSTTSNQLVDAVLIIIADVVYRYTSNDKYEKAIKKNV